MFSKLCRPFRWWSRQIEFSITARTHCLAHRQSDKAPLFTQDIKRTNTCSKWGRRGRRLRYFICLIVSDYPASFRAIISPTPNPYLAAQCDSGCEVCPHLHGPRSRFTATNGAVCWQGRCTVFGSPRGRRANTLTVGSNVKHRVWTQAFSFQPCPIRRNSQETPRHSQARTSWVFRFKLFLFLFFVR